LVLGCTLDLASMVLGTVAVLEVVDIVVVVVVFAGTAALAAQVCMQVCLVFVCKLVSLVVVVYIGASVVLAYKMALVGVHMLVLVEQVCYMLA